MNKLILATALCTALAACGDGGESTKTGDNTAAAGEAVNAGAPAETTTTTTTRTASAAFPRGSRIVEENGVTYRVNADGTRVQLGPNESRIVVENGTRYRVDPDGSRVRIDPQGVELDIDLPDVDVGINEKGNPDVDIGDRDPDGGR